MSYDPYAYGTIITLFFLWCISEIVFCLMGYSFENGVVVHRSTLKYIADLEEHMNHMEKYIRQVGVKKERGSNQLRMELPTREPKQIKVPYPITQDGVQYNYMTIWNVKDWNHFQRGDLLVEREVRTRKGYQTYVEWIPVDEYQAEPGDFVYNYSNNGNIETHLPCKWEYMGEAHV